MEILFSLQLLKELNRYYLKYHGWLQECGRWYHPMSLFLFEKIMFSANNIHILL